MNKLILLSMLLLGTITSQAQPPKGPANPGSVYGAGTTAAGAIAASELPLLLKSDTATMPVKVKAQVLAVCPKKGCWMRLQVNDSTTAFVKMKNYGFFVPTDIKGKTVVLEGLAYNHVTSVAELRHYAEDAKKPQAEVDAITQPKREIRFTANGILVLE